MSRDGHGTRLPADDSVPALVLKIGQYPVHSGGVAVIRTLGRLGVPVYAITEPGLPPAASSRYLAGRFAWRVTGREDQATLVPALREAGERIGRRSVLVAIDDEAAVLIAEHAAELSCHFLLPDVPASLPRRLASKTGLFELCREHGIPAPWSVTPASACEVAEFAATAQFPVVIKNAEPWQRRAQPVVPGTTVLREKADLLALASRLEQGQPRSPGLIMQEYIPREHAQDWVTHLYADAGADCPALFTGMKIRSWPPDAGVTACGYAVLNPHVAELAERLCKEVGYSGIADLDWRLDLRDGQYKLVDFNPRTGNQFRLFENESGVDVVRALHLDLTGRPVPRGRQVESKRLIVEHADVPARVAYRLRGAGGQPAPASTEYAWLARDDMLPFLVMVWHSLRPAASLARRGLGALARRARTRSR